MMILPTFHSHMSLWIGHLRLSGLYPGRGITPNFLVVLQPWRQWISFCPVYTIDLSLIFWELFLVQVWGCSENRELWGVFMGGFAPLCHYLPPMVSQMKVFNCKTTLSWLFYYFLRSTFWRLRRLSFKKMIRHFPLELKRLLKLRNSLKCKILRSFHFKLSYKWIPFIRVAQK